MVPDKLLWERLRVTRYIKSPKDKGITPVRKFRPNWMFTRALHWPNVPGISPVSLFVERSR
uniref:Uncharacterized protein n=1 Tax=Arundo donax TaxID=35708 RepID=A0A0A9DUG3_ARUDO